MTRAAAILALVLGIAWALCREQQRVAASWREDEDGVQPVTDALPHRDAYLERLAADYYGRPWSDVLNENGWTL